MIRDLLPSVWRSGESPLRKEEEHPFYALQREMDNVYDNFFRSFDLMPIGRGEGMDAFYPSIDIKDGEKDIVVKAELPGMEEKDVEVSLSDDTLTIRGEKKEEKEDKGKNYRHQETSYGSFSRVIPLPDGIDTEKADARFKNGVLTIALPKLEAKLAKSKKIAIKAE